MAYDAERYKNDPEYRDYRKKMSKQYYDKVKDSPEFKAKNLKRLQAWRKNNPDKMKAYYTSPQHQQAQRRYYANLTPEQRKVRCEKSAAKSKAISESIKKFKSDPKYVAALTEQQVLDIQTWIERRREYSRAYYNEHKDQCYARCRKWVEANLDRRRELARESYHRCKARKKAAAEALAGGDANA